MKFDGKWHFKEPASHGKLSLLFMMKVVDHLYNIVTPLTVVLGSKCLL
jgi:hypothetical protein